MPFSTDARRASQIKGGVWFYRRTDQGSDRGSGVNKFDRLSCDSDVIINASRSELWSGSQTTMISVSV
jgi:hypothetical protein